MVTLNSHYTNSNNSTQLVETVSIDYDDFNDNFLTCATCLCIYDGAERAPKLLPCSHTVCVHCLTRIVAASSNRRTATLDPSNNDQSSNVGNITPSQQLQNSLAVQQPRQTFRCPICRELITVPQNGGILALPPSFLVNQLLDLISTHRRRTLIPSCNGGALSSHMNQELLYCETCDQVFCSICTKHETAAEGTSNIISSKSSNVHTIIPVSIAMKRTSEIMLYKANECVSKLNCSRDVICAELDRLEINRNNCFTTLNETFNDLMNIIENRKNQLERQLLKACELKNRILNQQLTAIEIEKTKVMDECSRVHELIDLQSINDRIQILNDRLEQSTSGLYEPRENAYITVDLIELSEVKNVVNNAIGKLGQVRTTTTCPGYCILEVSESNGENLVFPRLVDKQIAILTAMDFDRKRRPMGGDPVTVKLIGPLDNIQADQSINNLGHQDNISSDGVHVIDTTNGQYIIRLHIPVCGRYRLHVYVLGRPVAFNDNIGHIEFSITNNIDPLCQYNKNPPMLQPTAITGDLNDSRVFVLDTGNCRIRILDTDLNYICDIQNIEAMRGRSSTGIGFLSNKTLITVNWRTNIITQMTLDGETIKTWTHASMVEPMCVVVDRTYDQVLIGDSSCNVHAFKVSTGEHLFTINNSKINGKSMDFVGTFMAIGPNSQIIVISGISNPECRCLDIYSYKGVYERSIRIATTDKSKQPYNSLTTCNHFVLATRRHSNSYFIDLIDINTEKLINTIDSNTCKLRRPAGMTAFTETQDSTLVNNDQHLLYYLLVTDVATDSVYKYQFF